MKKLKPVFLLNLYSPQTMNISEVRELVTKYPRAVLETAQDTNLWGKWNTEQQDLLQRLYEHEVAITYYAVSKLSAEELAEWREKLAEL
jgi:hypothetical protein